MEDFNLQEYIGKYVDQAMELAPSVIKAILVLIIGLWVIGRVTKFAKKMMAKNGTDDTVSGFLGSLINISLKAMLLISIAYMFGINATSFVAVLGAATFAIGMALQGSLANFAGGVMLLMFKPYKVGDLIEAQGFVGVVQDIQIFNTIMMTPDNKKIIVPNGAMSSGPITNISGQGTIRVDMTFGVGYGDDIDKVKQVIQEVSDANPKIMKEPGTDIFVSAHNASSVDFAVRPWCDSAHYWDVYFYMHEELKKAFDKHGFNIPYQTLDVNIVK